MMGQAVHGSQPGELITTQLTPQTKAGESQPAATDRFATVLQQTTEQSASTPDGSPENNQTAKPTNTLPKLPAASHGPAGATLLSKAIVTARSPLPVDSMPAKKVAGSGALPAEGKVGALPDGPASEDTGGLVSGVSSTLLLDQETASSKISKTAADKALIASLPGPTSQAMATATSLTSNSPGLSSEQKAVTLRSPTRSNALPSKSETKDQENKVAFPAQGTDAVRETMPPTSKTAMFLDVQLTSSLLAVQAAGDPTQSVLPSSVKEVVLTRPPSKPSGSAPPRNAAQRVQTAQTNTVMSEPPVAKIFASDEMTTAPKQGAADAFAHAGGDRELNAPVLSAGLLSMVVQSDPRTVIGPGTTGPLTLSSVHGAGEPMSLDLRAEAPGASLPHRVLAATPTALEVGVPGGTHGWLKIRAELSGSGEVNASLSGSSSAAASTLRRDLPALNSYLQAEKIAIGAVSVHPLTAAAVAALPEIAEVMHGDPFGEGASGRGSSGHRASDDLPGGMNGGAGGSGAQPDDSRDRSVDPVSNGSDDADETAAAAVRASSSAYGSAIGSGGTGALPPVEYGVGGGWLNVRA